MILTVDFIFSINLRCPPDSETRCHDIEDIAIEAGFRQQHDNATVFLQISRNSCCYSLQYAEIIDLIRQNDLTVSRHDLESKIWL